MTLLLLFRPSVLGAGPAAYERASRPGGDPNTSSFGDSSTDSTLTSSANTTENTED